MSIIAVFNLKGGVGKTTTALNLLAAVAQRGVRPLGIDLDPLAHLSHILGVEPRSPDDTMFAFFMHQRRIEDIATITTSGVMLCPAHLDLAKIDALLGKGVNIITRLRLALRDKALPPMPVLIDCGPLLNALSLNAVFACDLVLVPVSADYLSLQGAKEVERALNALEPVFKRRLPRRYLLTRYDLRRKMSAEIDATMRATFRPEEVCETRIRENAKLAESPSIKLDIFRHAPSSRGAHDYEALATELAAHGFVR
jgi:chromosome partitioning protein